MTLHHATQLHFVDVQVAVLVLVKVVPEEVNVVLAEAAAAVAVLQVLGHEDQDLERREEEEMMRNEWKARGEHGGQDATSSKVLYAVQREGRQIERNEMLVRRNKQRKVKLELTERGPFRLRCSERERGKLLWRLRKTMNVSEAWVGRIYSGQLMQRQLCSCCKGITPFQCIT